MLRVTNPVPPFDPNLGAQWLLTLYDLGNVPEVNADPNIVEPFDAWRHYHDKGREALYTMKVFAILPRIAYADVRRFPLGSRNHQIQICTDKALLEKGFRLLFFDLPVFGGVKVKDEVHEPDERYFFLCPWEAPAVPQNAVRILYHPLTPEGVAKRMEAARAFGEHG
jgi:hypothetical protein